jgi:hypothetical protein
MPVKTAGVFEAELDEAAADGLGSGEGLKGVLEAIDVFGVDDASGIADDLGEGTCGGADDGAAAGHGLDGWEAKALEERRINEGSGGAVEIGQGLVWDEAEEADISGVGRGSSGSVDVLGSMPVATAEGEQPGGASGGFEAVKGLDEADVVFGGVLEAGDVEEVGFVETGLGFGGGWVEAGVVEPVEDDALAFHRDAEEALDVLSGAGADGEDLILTACEPLHEHTSVNHAGEVVFSFHMEGCEVVDGSDGGAGRIKGHAAVAGDVEDIDALLAEPAGEEELMPEDVADSRTPFFCDRDEGHAVASELEEGHVLFEHEEVKFVLVSVLEEGADEGEDVLGDAGFAALDDRGGDGDFHARAGRDLEVKSSRTAATEKTRRSVA